MMLRLLLHNFFCLQDACQYGKSWAGGWDLQSGKLITGLRMINFGLGVFSITVTVVFRKSPTSLSFTSIQYLYFVYF